MGRLERPTFRLEGGDSIQLNYMGNKIILNSSYLTQPSYHTRTVTVKFCLLNPAHPSRQNHSQSFQHSVKNMLHRPEDIVPQEGVEPSRLAAAAFEVAVSTIPPPGQLLALFLYGVVMRPLYGTRTRVTSLKGRRP